MVREGRERKAARVEMAEQSSRPEYLETSGEMDSALISQIFAVISEFRPLYETATAISSMMCARFGYSSCAILLPRNDQDFLEIEGAAGLSTRYVEAVNSGFPIRIQDPMLSEGPTSEAFRTNRPVTIHDTETDGRFRRWRELARQQGHRSLISVPMSVHNQVIGALNCYHTDPHDFKTDEITTLVAVARQVGLAIEIARMVHEQQRTILRLNELTMDLKQHQELLERSEEIHERLTRLVLTNQGIPAIASALAEITGGSVVVQNCFLEPITSVSRDGVVSGIEMPPIDACAQRDAHPTTQLKPAAVIEISPRAAGDPYWVSAPVIAGREVLGCVSVAIAAPFVPALTLRAVGHAATVIALEMAKERLTHEMDVRDRRSYTDDLLSGRFEDASQMRTRGRYLGYDLRGPFQVIVFDAGGFRRQSGTADEPDNEAETLRRRFYDAVVQLARDHAPHLLVSGRDDRLSVVVTRAGEERRDVLEVDAIVRTLLARELSDLPVSAGIGRVVEALADIPVSFREATSALRAINQLGGHGRTLAFDQLGVVGVLLQASDPTELVAFARSRLGPVVEYDRLHDGILLDALGAYLKSGLAVAPAAAELNLHPNTVRYRLRKIETLLRQSLRDQSVLLDLNLAHKILQLTDDYDTSTTLSPIT